MNHSSKLWACVPVLHFFIKLQNIQYDTFLKKWCIIPAELKKKFTLVLVDIIENSFIDNRIAEHVTLLLLWVGQKMSIFWRQGKSSQGVVAICVVDPQGIFHTCTLGAVGRVSEGPVVVASDGVVRARHAVCSVVVSARFFFTVRLFASYHGMPETHLSHWPSSNQSLLSRWQNLIKQFYLLKMCWKSDK